MKILVLNSGSSSVKYQLVDIGDTHYDILAKGLIEKIGEGTSFIHHQANGNGLPPIKRNIRDHNIAIQSLEGILTGSDTTIGEDNGVITNISEIEAVGHRVVHGGIEYSASVIITEHVMEIISQLSSLAPLHNPPNLAGIKACEHLGIPQVAVFDTAFHQKMPPKAYLYALDRAILAGEDGLEVRRYGFHGTSHRYVWEKISEKIGKNKRIITIHLGNGCSITAIENGQVIDTSMGLTPLEGLMMGTRGGDIDPGVVLYLIEKNKWTVEQARTFFNNQCGLKGVSGVSNDLRKVYEASDAGNTAAKEAIDKYAYMVTKYIGAYMAALHGADVIAFTGGVGANSSRMREQILRGQEWQGIVLDSNRNGQEFNEIPLLISRGPVMVYAVQTNEEYIITRDTCELVKQVKK